ncbi:MAG TPA: N,N-dimethylformamidase beta subunit family domain-containing protein [Kineosporiaceae bacterium]|nr:N,N-dimethylformamidase beta subunit family domain-containing protein [Kineosporiaceae bacterium]
MSLDDPPLPADLDAGPRASCTPDVTPGWLARENARPGIRAAVPPTDTAANMYLDTVSAVCGQVVRAAVSAPAGTYRLRAVRIGWYGGAGGRVVATSAPFSARPQRDAKGTARARDPRWRVSAALDVGQGWPPGTYLVQLMSGSRAVQSAPLVVQAPLDGPRASLLFVVPSLTWTAYNGYGGRSLYRNWDIDSPAAAGKDRARQADLARPLEGPGVTALHRYTTPLVRAVERTGLDVDYAADVDVDRTPSLVRERAGLLTGAHTEYVTRRMYDAFETARDRGTNLGFLGGNGFYWQARVSRDAAHRPVTMSVYRKASDDPVSRTAPDLTTVRWRDAPLSRPEAGLQGAAYDGMGVVMPLAVLQAPAWLGWRRGQVLPAAAAGEVDAVDPAGSPAGVSVLAAGGAPWRGRLVRAMVTYYVAMSGAAVFDAGTMFLGCATDDSCSVVSVPGSTSVFWSSTISRVVTAFATPRFGATHPAPGQGVVPSHADLVHRFGHRVTGRTIGDDD